MQRQSSREIEREAADWAARLDRGALTAEEESAFNAWRGADPRRLGAFMRMRAIALHAERAQALGSAYDPESYAVPQREAEAEAGNEGSGPAEEVARPSRRRFLAWGGAAAAATVAGIVGVGLLAADPVYATGLGEIRVVTLGDGSAITLNTATRIAVHFDADRRSVTLLEGEALFDVAHDAARPFVVDAGDASVRAVGTSFTVRRLERAPVEVLVREGAVELTRPGAQGPVRLVANTRTVARPNAPAAPSLITPEDMRRELAWREGRIALEGETLAHAATVFARYSEIRIIIDPAVRNEEITGLFAANDPVSFARAAAASLDLQARVGQGEVRISRP